MTDIPATTAKATLHETVTIAKFDGDGTEGKTPVEIVTYERVRIVEDRKE